MSYRVCFVCTGNICRSPMAATVFLAEAAALGRAAEFEVDSAGVAAEVGLGMDRRARRALQRRGYSPVAHRARQFEPLWLAERDLVVVMDRSEFRWVERRSPAALRSRADVRLLLSFAAPAQSDGDEEVPDPYYGDDSRFETCLDQIVLGCGAMLRALAGSQPA